MCCSGRDGRRQRIADAGLAQVPFSLGDLGLADFRIARVGQQGRDQRLAELAGGDRIGIGDDGGRGGAGAIVSTGADLNRFFTALVTGKLLPAPQLAQMEQTISMQSFTEMTYGLGLIRFELPCGSETKELWGHSGGIPGFSTMAIATTKGTAATVSVNTEQTNEQFSTAFTTIACAIS